MASHTQQGPVFVIMFSMQSPISYCWSTLCGSGCALLCLVLLKQNSHSLESWFEAGWFLIYELLRQVNQSPTTIVYPCSSIGCVQRQLTLTEASYIRKMKARDQDTVEYQCELKQNGITDSRMVALWLFQLMLRRLSEGCLYHPSADDGLCLNATECY